MNKEIITCGKCGLTTEIGDEGYCKEEWTYPWVDIPLCDNCHVDIRIMIADYLEIDNWGRIDL